MLGFCAFSLAASAQTISIARIQGGMPTTQAKALEGTLQAYGFKQDKVGRNPQFPDAGSAIRYVRLSPDGNDTLTVYNVKSFKMRNVHFQPGTIALYHELAAQAVEYPRSETQSKGSTRYTLPNGVDFEINPKYQTVDWYWGE